MTTDMDLCDKNIFSLFNLEFYFGILNFFLNNALNSDKESFIFDVIALKITRKP